MSNDFDSESLNLGVQPVQYYVDNDGSLKFISEYISSSNFNGTIPVVSTTISASSIVPGMYISVTGSGVNSQYYPVVSISVDDPELEDTPSQSMTVTYIDGENIAENIYLDQLDLVDVKYENWDEKDLGTSGWGITSGGNAIFSNVAVRGRIEATEGEISGDLTLGGSLTASTNFGFVKLSASGIYGVTSSGNFHLDTTTGEIDITGNINANSGQIKTLNIGPTQYPIFNIFGISTSSATTSASDSGQFILVTPIYKDYAPPPGGGPAGQVYNKKLIPGDVFRLQNTETTSSCVIEYYTPVGASAMFNTGAKVQPDDTGPWYPQDNKFIVLSASYGESDFSYMSIGPYAVYVNKYHCKYHWYPDNFPLQIDFNGVTTASGTFNIGYLSFVASQESVFKTSNGFESRTSIDGIVLANYRKKITNYSLGDFLQVPDYIDLGGTFKLGNGNITFDGDNLNIIGNINATGGEISGNLSLGGSLTASTNNGQLIISSSGISGITASGSFHLDNIDGEMSFTGDITANSGKVKKLTIGAGKSYPIVSLTGTASVKYGERDSGNFILTVDPNSKNFSPGDYFYLAGVKTSGSAFIIDNGTGLNSPIDPAGFFTNLSLNKDGSWNNTYVYQIITASYLSGSPQYDKYFCRLQQGSIASNYDFSQVTGTSGSMNFGYVYFGEYSTYSLSGGTFIDGFVLSTVGPGTFFETYIPDYVDLSGKLRLAKGKINFDGTTLSVSGNISGNIKNNNRTITAISASVYTLQASDSWSILEINSSASTVIYIPYPSTTFDSNSIIDFVQINSGSVIFKTVYPAATTLNSYLNKTTLAGKWTQANLRLRSQNNWLLTGDLL